MTDRQIVLSVLTQNAPQATAALVRSSGLPHERVIVVSNASCDAANAELKAALPAATVIRVQPARGIAFCYNVGLRLPAEQGWKPQPAWTILANDDVLFDRDWLKTFTKAVAAHPHALQINLAYPKNSYSCTAIHRDLVRKIGWFDERFTGMFYEDDDWHLRLCEHTKCGWGERVHEKQRDGIFARAKCALHDHGLRARDRERYGSARSLSKAPNERAFFQKWARVEREGWCGKGLPGRFARRQPEVEWYSRAPLGGAMA